MPRVQVGYEIETERGENEMNGSWVYRCLSCDAAYDYYEKLGPGVSLFKQPGLHTMRRGCECGGRLRREWADSGEFRAIKRQWERLKEEAEPMTDLKRMMKIAGTGGE